MIDQISLQKRKDRGQDDAQSCTQYASKFGKLSSGHRTGKGQFSFQSERKATPKNAQTTAQLLNEQARARIIPPYFYEIAFKSYRSRPPIH